MPVFHASVPCQCSLFLYRGPFVQPRHHSLLQSQHTHSHTLTHTSTPFYNNNTCTNTHTHTHTHTQRDNYTHTPQREREKDNIHSLQIHKCTVAVSGISWKSGAEEVLIQQRNPEDCGLQRDGH